MSARRGDALRLLALVPVAIAAVLAACGGSGGSGAPVAPVVLVAATPTPSPTPRPGGSPTVIPTASPAPTATPAVASFAITVVVPSTGGGTGSVRRSPQYVSPGTLSFTAYDGRTLIYVGNVGPGSPPTLNTVYATSGPTVVTGGGCTNGAPATCTITLTTSVGTHAFDLMAYGSPQTSSTPTGFILSEGELTVTLVAGPNAAQTLTPLGVADKATFVSPALTYQLNGTGALVGIIGTAYTFQYAIDDASRQPDRPTRQLRQRARDDRRDRRRQYRDDDGGVADLAARVARKPNVQRDVREQRYGDVHGVRRHVAQHDVRIRARVQQQQLRRRHPRHGDAAVRAELRGGAGDRAMRIRFMKISYLAVATAAAAALAACGGGGGGTASGGTGALAPTAAPLAVGQIPLTLTIPRNPSSRGRAPQFLSPGTGSMAIYDGTVLAYAANTGFDGGSQFATVYASSGPTTVTPGTCTFTSSRATCSLTLTANVGAHKFDVITYPNSQATPPPATLPTFAGIIASEGELAVTLNPGTNPAQTLTLLGVASQVIYAGLSEAAYNDTVTYGFRIQDSTNSQIVQPGNAYDNGPVTITASPTGIVTIAPSSFATPPASLGDQNFDVTCINAAGGQRHDDVQHADPTEHGIRVRAHVLDVELLRRDYPVDLVHVRSRVGRRPDHHPVEEALMRLHHGFLLALAHRRGRMRRRVAVGVTGGAGGDGSHATGTTMIAIAIPNRTASSAARAPQLRLGRHRSARGL